MRILSTNARLRALLLLITCFSPLRPVAAESPTHRPSIRLTFPAAEEATPDCPIPEAEGDPGERRAAHLAALGVDRWHQAGFRGKGVKIAVLDTGFRGYREHLGKELPAQVKTASFRRDGQMEARDSQHGILCAEVIHALAPDAELLLATWEPDDSDQFLKAVRWARHQGARIMSCSVIMPSWSDGDGGGQLHTELTEALGDKVLCFASAGNTARRHWSGAFHDAGNAFHEWRTGETNNLVRPWSSERVSVELYWKPGCRYELIVQDDNGTVVGRSAGHCGATRCSAVVRFLPSELRRYRVRLHLLEGPAGAFHLVALGGDLRCSTSSGSIAFPADGPEVIAVGAVDGEGRRASYSSCGPNSKQPKPDLVALVPFPCFCRERPFTGTSAAAPQAAALAALWWGRHADWKAGEVREVLCRTARDLGPPGHDWETGYGMVVLPARDEPTRPTAARR
jgi:subtilisin family serine protease